MSQFRPALKTDYPDICKLIESREELFLVYPKGRYPFTELQLNELAQERKELTVATIDDRVIGFASLYNYQAAQSAFIGNIIIDKSHRGKGLGRQLVSHMLKLGFEKHQLPEIRISVFSDNDPALSLYKSFGFTVYDSEKRTDFSGQTIILQHMKLKKK